MRLTAAVRVDHHVGGEHAEQRIHVAAVGGLEEHAGEFLAVGPPCRERRAVARLSFGGDVLPGAAKISRQFTSVLPVILATSG